MKLVHSTRPFIVALMALLIPLASLGLTGTPALAACASLPTDKGQATFTVSLPSTGNYRVWSRVYSPSANNNGYYMQIDQAYCSIVVGDSSTIPVGVFTWVNYRDGQPANPLTLSLVSGSHTVVVAGLDPGVGIDRIMFLSDLACVPTGTGDNCNATTTSAPATGSVPTTAPGTAAPTPVVIGSVTPSSSVSGTLILSTPPDGSSEKVEYSVDGKPITGDSLDTTQLTNGEHTITATTTNPDGSTSLETTTINVNNDLNFWQWVANLLANQWWWMRIVVIALVFGAMVIAVLYRRFHSRIHFAHNNGHPFKAPAKTYLQTLSSEPESHKLL